jgi:hypothetical protein
MYNLADNTRGSVFILDGWNERRHTPSRGSRTISTISATRTISPSGQIPATHQSWLYLPLTDKLIRYKYSAGDNAPTSPPETLIRFPDYGLNYKYGGWHLTRTVAIAQVRGETRVFVSAGSSCNYCQEREVLRAAIVSMDPDGKHPSLVAQGMRNAVDLRSIAELGGALFATNMGDDHLGDKLPEDTFFQFDTASAASPPNYGWPTCYFAHGKPVHDTTPLPSFNDPSAIASPPTASAVGQANDSVYGKQTGVAAAGTNLTAGGGHAFKPDPNAALGLAPAPLKSCEQVPAAYTTFAAHSSPLGFRILRTRRSITRLELSCRPARREPPAHRHRLSCRPVFTNRPQRRATSSLDFSPMRTEGPLSTAAPAASCASVLTASCSAMTTSASSISSIRARSNASCSVIRPHIHYRALTKSDSGQAFLRRVSAKDAVIPFCN